MSSYAELISIGTFTLDRAEKSPVVEQRQAKTHAVIKRNYRKPEMRAESHGIFARARSMFFRSRMSELSIR